MTITNEQITEALLQYKDLVAGYDDYYDVPTLLKEGLNRQEKKLNSLPHGEVRNEHQERYGQGQYSNELMLHPSELDSDGATNFEYFVASFTDLDTFLYMSICDLAGHGRGIWEFYPGEWQIGNTLV